MVAGGGAHLLGFPHGKPGLRSLAPSSCLSLRGLAVTLASCQGLRGPRGGLCSGHHLPQPPAGLRLFQAGASRPQPPTEQTDLTGRAQGRTGQHGDSAEQREPTEGPLAQAQAGQVVGLGAGPAVTQHQLAPVPTAEALVLGPLPFASRSATPAFLLGLFALVL